MRIAFLGKGGAGKTTTAAGFIRYACERFPYVLAVDADVNAHLKGALRIEGEVKELGGEFEWVTDYLKGGRSDLAGRPFVGSTPPSLRSNFIRLSPDDRFISRYHLLSGNLSLVTVGTYKESDVSGSCYHTKLKGLASVFHHMLDGDDDLVVADTTAGTDNVATSLSLAYDLNVFVVEPTRKSLNVYLDYIKIAPHLEDRVFVVGNKVDGPDDEAFILAQVPGERFLGSIPYSRNLKRFEQGRKEAIVEFYAEQTGVFDAILKTLRGRRRDWGAYLDLLRQTHAKACRDWFDDYFGYALDEGLDGEFSYEKVLTQVVAPDSFRAPAFV